MALRFTRDRMAQFSRFLWRRLMHDKCFETAGSLSYTTLVSLVPLAVAVFAMFSAFPVFEGARTTLTSFVFQNFVPAAGNTVQGAIQEFADNAKKLTGISILVMLFSALSMMVSIEDRLNNIWRVDKARGWGPRLLLYWAALTLGPILIVGGIAATSYLTAMPLLQGAVDQFHSVEHRFLSVLPFVVTFLTLWLLYAVVPNRKVPRYDAALGALFGAVLFEIVRWGFNVFVKHAQTYQQIYGAALAVIPIFLLWIYLSWVIVIVVASLTAAASAFEYRTVADKMPEDARFMALLMVLGYFVDAQRAGDGVNLSHIRKVEPRLRGALLAECVESLQRGELIKRAANGEWLLTRSLDSTDILRVYRYSRYRLPLDPVERAAALNIRLPKPLLVSLEEAAGSLRANLGVSLDRVYPANVD